MGSSFEVASVIHFVFTKSDFGGSGTSDRIVRCRSRPKMASASLGLVEARGLCGCLVLIR